MEVEDREEGVEDTLRESGKSWQEHGPKLLHISSAWLPRFPGACPSAPLYAKPRVTLHFPRPAEA